MGKKRVIFQAEVAFPADNPEEAASLSRQVAAMLDEQFLLWGAEMVRFTVLSAAEDPEPDPSGDDVIVRPPGWGDEA